MGHKHVILSILLFALVATVTDSPGSSAKDTQSSAWEHRKALIHIDRSILSNAPKTAAGDIAGTNPGRPFTYEEQVYNKPQRDWLWSGAKYTVIFAGGACLTYVSAGLLAPWVGSAIGGFSGLTGAAAVSQGLAFLGGGAIAAGGFGMAGGTVVVGLITDLAVSAALEYSLRSINEEKRFEGLNLAIRHLDANQKEPAAWLALDHEAAAAASKDADYVIVAHAVASACMRWAADENISRALQDAKIVDAETTISERQRLLMTAAIRLLEESRRLEPSSSLVHHSIGNAYWWLSVRGGLGRDQDSDFSIPSTSRFSGSERDEVACFKAALWHYGVGAACEPRNTHIRSNWAMALQADGTLHEAIAVVAGGLPNVAECRATDQAALLRTTAMLEYQAFSRSPLANRSEQDGGPPSLDDAPMLMAAMQAYSKAVELDSTDLSGLTSLLQIYRTSAVGTLKPPPSVMALEEVQFRFTEVVLAQEKSLASLPPDKKHSSYKPGQLLSHYRDLLRWCFDGLGQTALEGKHLSRLFNSIEGWIDFAQPQSVKERPFTRDLAIRVHSACKQHNVSDTFSAIRGYSLKSLNLEIDKTSEDP